METPLSVAEKHVTFAQSQVFFANGAIHTKKKPKKEVDYFWKHQTSNSRLRYSIWQFDYLPQKWPTTDYCSNKHTHFRIPGVPGLHFVPEWVGTDSVLDLWSIFQGPDDRWDFHMKLTWNSDFKGHSGQFSSDLVYLGLWTLEYWVRSNVHTGP